MTPQQTRRGATQQILGWRAATATRVFALALATGQTISADRLPSLGVLLLGLALVVLIACSVDFDASPAVARLIPVAEGVLAAVILVTTVSPVSALLVYLAVPPVVAGLRAGWVTVLNAGLAIGVTLVGAWVAAEATGTTSPAIPGAVPWAALGVGVGLLAAWQTRSVRALEESQAPLLEAHRLLSQLHSVSRQLPGGLDSEKAAQSLLTEVTEATGAERALLFVRAGSKSVVPLTHTGGGMSGAEHDLARECLERRRRITSGQLAALLVRVGEHDVGAVVLRRSDAWRKPDLNTARSIIDRHSLRLDSALLFDDVRTVATTEERARLARDIHDGVAQDVASLGYLIDELLTLSAEPSVREVAEELRSEVSRVVGELRLSIFDLRQGVSEATSLSDALSEYARELGTRSGLAVEVSLDVSGPPLPFRTQAELLRIAQEAIANVRKHARATTLWISLATDGTRVRMAIADDGRATLAPVGRDGHYGLQTMRERAHRIGAELTLGTRPSGGAVVTVETRDTRPATNPPPVAVRTSP